MAGNMPALVDDWGLQQIVALQTLERIDKAL